MERSWWTEIAWNGTFNQLSATWLVITLKQKIEFILSDIMQDVAISTLSVINHEMIIIWEKNRIEEIWVISDYSSIKIW